MTISHITKSRLLVVEDELSIRDSVIYALESEGFEVDWTASGTEALQKHTSSDYHLIVLDIGLPDVNGLDVCRELRTFSSVPVIFLTARNAELDRVVGLELGADDYVTKPFSPRELSARVRANIRRTHFAPLKQMTPEGLIRNEPKPRSPFQIDYEQLQISYRGTLLTLSRYEFRLLAVLIEHPGRVYSRAQLMDRAWEEPDASMDRTVDSHIKSIRAKLRAVCETVDPILTHRGIGYALKEHL